MAEYAIALDPALGIDPQALADAWNADADARAAGTLTPVASIPKTFHDPAAMLFLTTAVGIASGVLTSVISHILLEKVGTKKQFVVQQVAGPDGRETLVITER